MNIDIAKDLSNLATFARQKADYMRYLPEPDKRNTEQAQSTSAVLEELAGKIDKVIITHFVTNNTFKDGVLEAVVNRQIRSAIRKRKTLCVDTQIAATTTKNL